MKPEQLPALPTLETQSLAWHRIPLMFNSTDASGFVVLDSPLTLEIISAETAPSDVEYVLRF